MLGDHYRSNGYLLTVAFKVTREQTRLLRPLILTMQRLASLTASQRRDGYYIRRHLLAIQTLVSSQKPLHSLYRGQTPTEVFVSIYVVYVHYERLEGLAFTTLDA